MILIDIILGGFIPKDSVKEDYYYNPGIEITTSEPGQIFDGNYDNKFLIFAINNLF